jgi:hypothetical protein
MFPDGFNKNQAATCPTCGASPWRNCKDMQWFEVHMTRAVAAEPVYARW